MAAFGLNREKIMLDRNRIETDPRAIAYGMDLMESLAQVRVGQKPLVIGSYGKCYTACVALEDIADETPGLEKMVADLVCEDGELHRHVFVCAAGAPYAREAIDAIFGCISVAVDARDDREREEIREDLQIKLGHLLGYSAREILDFVMTDVAETCPCDCCGSPYTLARGDDTGIVVVEEPVEHVTLASKAVDPNPGRFVPYSYRY